MKCHPCDKTVQGSPFVSPECIDYRSSTLLRHQKTSGHISALQLPKMSNDMFLSAKKHEKHKNSCRLVVLKVSATQFSYGLWWKKVLLWTVYWVAQNGISVRNFTELLKLQHKNTFTTVLRSVLKVYLYYGQIKNGITIHIWKDI